MISHKKVWAGKLRASFPCERRPGSNLIFAQCDCVRTESAGWASPGQVRSANDALGGRERTGTLKACGAGTACGPRVQCNPVVGLDRENRFQIRNGLGMLVAVHQAFGQGEPIGDSGRAFNAVVELFERQLALARRAGAEYAKAERRKLNGKEI